jgi:hypothetical protein
MALSTEDKAVLELLEKASEQYENYLALADVTRLTATEPVSEPALYNWDRPLTLVITDR